ncbi:MAG: 2-C-methyl-D-erythritol 4-phosphate cytidylyltransferase [Paucimonas sp.]|nr:2-C-methyl-D-erythritol 4-phosphate cytidylyltransferase [Paucimonas sp.]
MPRYYALIPAAGAGSRMQSSTPKQYLPLRGRAMLAQTVEAFLAMPVIEHIFVIVSPDDAYVDQLGLTGERVSICRVGGASRQQSVLNGLQQMRTTVQGEDWVLVHDAARPGLTPALVSRLIEEVGTDAVGGLLALPVVDTIKQAHDGRAQHTVPRAGLWAAQTPQMFRHALLERALGTAIEVTDEASAVEALGLAPLLVPGSMRNMKVTLPEDVALAEIFLGMPS